MSTSQDSDPHFADLLDDVLDQLLNGDEPDPDEVAARHPHVKDRVAEALSLAGSLAGRKVSTRPTLQGYEISRELGRGGMGTVYLARQSELKREVAIKVLPHSFGLSESSRERFLEEARALAQIKHNHIVDIHRIVDDGELLAFEMEYIDGPSLHTVLATLREHRERTGSRPTLQHLADAIGVPVEQLGTRSLTQFFVHLLLKVARALAAVHAAGFVHRDVKPANLLLRNNGDPVVVDFGLVRLRGLEATHAGRFAGTPVYSSPEQLRGDILVGPASDVYSLGVTLYECLTLATPFAGRTTTDLLQRIERGRFKPLRRVAPDAPRDLETIVAHAMEVDPMQRYADAGAFADDLQRLLELHPIQAKPAGPVRRVEKFLRRNRRTVLAASLGALLVALTLFPILHQVEAASRAREAAAEHIRAARSHVIMVDSGTLDWRHAVWGSATRPQLAAERPDNNPLRAALTDYDRAVELSDVDDDILRERDVVRVAMWLRDLDVDSPDELEQQFHGDDYDELTRNLGPKTKLMARQLAGIVDEQADWTFGNADDKDRLTAGLLAYLFGNFRHCERAWSTERAQISRHPLVDAGLGRLLLADGMLEAAYSRLLQAHSRFPKSGELTLELADTALRLGDLDLARQWLERVDDEAKASVTARRLRLDLRAATEDSTKLVAEYVALVREDPYDPTARHRLAQLALRRGDMHNAAMHLDLLLQGWPEAARFRLDRARVALQQRNLFDYADQVMAVLAQDFGRGRSRGTVADFLEVLRIGGLEQLYLEAVAKTEHETAGRTMFGGETPIHAFAPEQLTRNFEGLARMLNELRHDVRAVRKASQPMDDYFAHLLTSVPMAGQRTAVANALSPQQRVLLEVVPPIARRVYAYLAPTVRQLLVSLHFSGWRRVALDIVPPVAPQDDLSPSAILGSSIVRLRDRTGDGIDEHLIACSTPHPERGDARLLMIDGRTHQVLESITSKSDVHLFGHAIAAVEDIDGDGVQDWIVGCPGAPKATNGLVEVISGAKAQRLKLLSDDDHGFGAAVTGLGDCNGDGVPDFAVATTPLLLNSAAHGGVRIYSGATFEVLTHHQNDRPGVWFGATITNVGDTNADGVADLAIGGNYGNGQGLVRVLSGRDGSVLQTWSDRSNASGYGTFVGPVGDVDGDECADVIVSAVSPNDTVLSHVFVYSGRTGEQLADIPSSRRGDMFGRSVTPFFSAGMDTVLAIGAPLGGEPRAGAVELCKLDGHRLTTVVGPLPNGIFGWVVSSIDDVDGDRLPELLVSATAGGKHSRVFQVRSSQLLQSERPR